MNPKGALARRDHAYWDSDCVKPLTTAFYIQSPRLQHPP